MIDEAVHLESFRPQWEQVFVAERNRLATCLKVEPNTIEHIGSTAVSGMVCKPIIDIMLGAKEVPPPEAWFKELVYLGYESLGEAGVPGRWYFRLRTEPFRNLHIVERLGSHWVNNLAFRDYLRRSPVAARRYETAKHAAVAAGATTLVSYSRAKREIVLDLLAEALKGDDLL